MDGRIIKQEILDELKKKVELINKKPFLVVIQIGNNDASNIYIEQKRKMCDYVNYKFKHIKLNENVNQKDIISIIEELNNDSNVTSILLQLPIPKHLNENEIINKINPLKDVDGLTDLNIGKLMHNKETLIPCTPLGIITLLQKYNIDVISKNIVIVGRSNLVGKPLSILLINNGATVTCCNSKTIDLNSITKKADILISATGKINLIKKNMIKKDVIIIDVGITRDKNNKLHGDVDYEKCKNIASFITPVPGGVGPLTIASLANNILKSYKMQINK